MSRNKFLIVAFVAIGLLPAGLYAQDKRTDPLPKTAETIIENQDSLKVFVEEVRIPITAYDEYGRFDPTVEINDLMVKEDGVLQQLKSIYRIPTNVLLLLDTGGELNLAKNVRLTREVAINLVSNLKNDDRISVIQVNNGVESVQNWTTEKSEVIRSLNNKLLAGKRTALAQGIATAVEQLKETPAGNRHLILISDGIVSQNEGTLLALALKNLIEANITTHVISYTSLGLTAKKPPVTRPREKSFTPLEAILALPRMKMPNDNRPDLRDILEAKGGTVVSIDRLFRLGTSIKGDLQRREVEFGSLTEETGGGLWLPGSADEMINQAVEVAQKVDSQYVITYRPQRSIKAKAGEYLKLHVISRRVGLNVQARRGYLAMPLDEATTTTPNNFLPPAPR
jgi:VWFA-related protein